MRQRVLEMSFPKFLSERIHLYIGVLRKPPEILLSVTIMLVFLQPLVTSVSLGKYSMDCPTHCTCDSDLEYDRWTLNCSRFNNLDSVPLMDEEAAEKVINIYISGQPRLTELHSDVLHYFTRLKQLTIKESGLNYLSDTVFENLRSLRVLNFERDKIRVFPEVIVKNLNVTEIFLKGNPLGCRCANLWLLQPSNPVTISHSVCTQGEEHTAAAESSSPEHLRKYCALIKIPMISATLPVPEEGNVTVTCPIQNMHITWDMFNIQSSWQEKVQEEQRMRRTYIDISNVSKKDQFHVITCKGVNATHKASASIMLVIPAAPVITSVYFGGTSFKTNFHLRITGWPLPVIDWTTDDGSFKGQETPRLSDINSRGEFLINGYLQPSPNHGTLFRTVASNRYGNDTREDEIVTGVGDPHVPIVKPPEEKDFEPNYTTEYTLSPAQYTVSSARDTYQLTVKIVLACVGGALCVCLLVAMLLVFLFRDRIKCYTTWQLKKKQARGAYNLAARVDDIMVENPSYNGRSSSASVKKISPEDICTRCLIGEGNFGLVFFGECTNLEKKKRPTPVAIKTLKGDSNEALRRDFEREAELLTTFKHENIVHLYGVCTEAENWMLIFEYMEYGDLHKYLRSRAPDTAKRRDPNTNQPKATVLTQAELLLIIKQIAKGLRFLAAQHFVHRDLATRNCLVGKGLTVKIGDFGLARDIYITDYYRIGSPTMLPYRWLALESIRFGKFTTKSDVWSFGVMMWEVFTYGQKPWCELSIPEMVERIEVGEHLFCPKSCPENIYKLMVDGCWKLDEEERYDMTKICDILLDINLEQPEYLDLIGDIPY